MPHQLGTDPASGVDPEIADGRRTLRLVKIRLALTLIAVAILPFAAVAPVARALLDGTRTSIEDQLTTDAGEAAAAARRELVGIAAQLGELAVSPEITAAIAAAPGGDVDAVGRSALATLLTRPPGIVSGVAIVDPSGAARLRVGASPAPLIAPGALPNGAPAMLAVPVPGSSGSIEIVTAVAPAEAGSPAGSGSSGSGAWTLAAWVPTDALLAWASPGAAAANRTVELVDVNGSIVGTVGPRGGINLPGTMIDLAANGSETPEGTAALAVSALDGWRVVASTPLPVTSIPIPAIAALAGLLALLIGFIWWMGRQIIQPAAELDAQRSRLHEAYEVARAAALRDSLTGLGNHRAFQEAVTRMVDQSRRYATTFSLVLLDIDEFKRVNDSRGHATGDELLAEVGQLIRATVRVADAGYRIGGDEFALLLPSTDARGAETTAKRLLSRGLEERGGGVYSGPISFSAGITTCPDLGKTRMELTAQADAALYRGKRGGRTTVSIFDPALDRGHVDEEMRAELSAAVAAVIEGGDLRPVYQPIVHLPTGRVLGYEGLVRVGPASGFPHTGALFDAAEVGGRVLDLDRAALDVVLGGSGAIAEPTLISLNVSPRSFEAPEFNATVFLAILRRHGVDPGRVLLELTERDAIRDPDRIRSTILQLQSAGVRVAADDVGAGNAGLRLLSQFRFDVVKIDLSLVQGDSSHDQTLAVLTSLVQLARRWGALTIAEGVETASQLRMIRQLDVDAGQGYLLGRPDAVLETDRIDLDALAGDGTARSAAAPAAPAATATPRPVVASGGLITGPGSILGTRRPKALPAGLPAPSGPAPTAASIIAGGAPNPFASV